MADNRLKFFKVLTLPKKLEKNALYLVKGDNDENFKVHISDQYGEETVSTVSKSEVDNLIALAAAGTLAFAKTYTDNSSEQALKEANDYTDEALSKFNPPSSILVLDLYGELDPDNRDHHNCFILVRDARGDKTVKNGSATYVWDAAKADFAKVSEHESLDLKFEWDSIENRPNSTPQQIDEAVQNAKHVNIEVLDELDQGEDGQLLYRGKSVNTDVLLHTVEW